MSRWKNFKIWRGRLPHWRADDVRYFVTFKHRRALNEDERLALFRQLLRPEGRKWDLLILCVLPERTELIFSVRTAADGQPVELSQIVEPAKRRAAKDIGKISKDRYPPFWEESYDRIIRDEPELEQRWQEVYDSPVIEELVEDPTEWETLYVAAG
ncbi:MAG TPA: hypothetical protein VM328_11570 [Fimbriimonadaceae bacterium]|nr:hypothetical protein [Fimbriimonadaceae bacterium]